MSPQHRWQVVYVTVAFAAICVVARWNEQLSGFFAGGSLQGSVGLFLFLPLLAIASRPVYVKTGIREQRAIGALYALRSGRPFRFIGKTLLLWIVLMAAVTGLFLLLFRNGGDVAVATVSNWLYLTAAAVLLLHVLPTDYVLPSARPVAVYVVGPKGSGKTTFIAVAALDRRSEAARSIEIVALPSAAALTSALYSSNQQGSTVRQTDAVFEHNIVRRHIWSQFVGVRPLPAEFCEVGSVLPPAPKRRIAFVLTLAAADREAGDMARIGDQLLRIHEIAGGDPGQKIRPPVAVALTGIDDWQTAQDARVLLSDEARRLLDENCRSWAPFAVTDREPPHEADDEFRPAGHANAIQWLLRRL